VVVVFLSVKIWGGREAYIIYFLTIFIKITKNFKEISENVK
jgi:hypothetical protein